MAEKEYLDYLRNGPKKSTEYLLEPLKDQDLKGASLLDIGGGVGAVVWELWEQGIRKAYYQELSQAYSESFQKEVNKRGLEDSIEISIGDFVDCQQQLPEADIVTLDKVICCYEDFETLVQQSTDKARYLYVYTIPMDVWWVKAVSSAASFFRQLFGDKLRTWVHPVSAVEALTVSCGFDKVYEKQHREWYTVLYKRSS